MTDTLTKKEKMLRYGKNKLKRYIDKDIKHIFLQYYIELLIVLERFYLMKI